MGLRRKLLDVVLRDLPNPDSELHEGSARYDELLGGKKSAGVWGRFSKNFGTTCIVTLDGWAIDAGFPDDMVVAHDTPTGGGTPILHALYSGADQRGWTRTPKRGELPDLRPGDIYISNHTTKDGSDGTHGGVVVAVRPAADGKSMEVDTADGGQGTRQDQYMGRRTRTFRLSDGPHPVTISTPGVGESWLERWIAVGGDEPDDVPTQPGAGGAGGALGGGGDGTAAALLGVVGLAMLAGGLYWYLEREPRGLNAVTERDRMLAARLAVGHVEDAALRRELVEEGALTPEGRLTTEGYGDGRWARLYGYAPVADPLDYGDGPVLGINALASFQDVTAHLAPRHGDIRDFEARRRYELALAGAGFEVTGAGTSFGTPTTSGRRVTGTDVDVRCRGACDEGVLRDLADRVGVTVADVRTWSAS